MNCLTTHSLAKRSIRGQFNSEKKLTDSINANELAEYLNLREIALDGNNRLTARTLAHLILETIRRFTQSSDDSPQLAIVPRAGRAARMRDDVWGVVEKHTKDFAANVWTRMCDPKDPLPLGHDGYLKLWAQSKPEIIADFIMVDEAQDTNPVVLDVLKSQSAQMIYVGDRFQQIYEWRGAINAMEKVETSEESHLTTSFRFGDSIADAATTVLSFLGESRRLTGNSKIKSRIGPTEPVAILTRSNATAMSAVIDAIDKNKRPHLVGNKEEFFKLLKGVQDLKNGQQSIVPEFFGFANWSEVVEFARSGEADHLSTFVNLVESRGERQLFWALNRTVEEAKSDIVISTAHRAKGREWKSVQVMDDFIASGSNSPGGKARASRLKKESRGIPKSVAP